MIPDIVDYIEPLATRRTSPFRRSRLAVLADGTTQSVLMLLARERFGDWAQSQYFPFWVDGNYRNESMDNVALATRTPSRMASPPSASFIGRASASRALTFELSAPLPSIRACRRKGRNGVHTPGKLFAVLRHDDDGVWRVVTVSAEQGVMMRRRGVDVFPTAAQAYTIARKRNGGK